MLKKILNSKLRNYTAIIATALSTTGCLNSAVPSNSQMTESASATEVFAISPTKVHLDWPDARSAYQYKIFSGDIETDEAISTVNFSYADVDVISNSQNELKVYNFSKEGEAVSSKPVRHYRFSTWAPFEEAPDWTGQTKEFAGIEIKWSYLPWRDKGMTPKTGVAEQTKMKCYFRTNGTLSDDPFQPSSITISAPISEGLLRAGNALAPLTRYSVGCEVEYADGTASRKATLWRELTTSANLQEVNNIASIDLVPVNGIMVSRAISFLVNNATNGTLDTSLNFINQNNEVKDRVLNFNATNLPQNTNVKFDTPFPIIPGKVYGGKFRLSGSYTGSAPGSLPVNIASKDLYVKSADDISEVIHSRLDHILGASDAGRSTASGDFNCDGHDDLAIGMPKASWQATDTSIRRTGVVIVYYGGPSGLYVGAAPSQFPTTPEEGDPNIPPLMLVPPEGYQTPNDISDPSNTTDFGYALAVGNFNRDFLTGPEFLPGQGNNPIGGRPCMDLAIGIPGLSVAGGNISVEQQDMALRGAGGAVLIRYGSPSGLDNGAVSAVSRNNLDYDGSCPGTTPIGELYHPSNTQGTSGSEDKIIPDFKSPRSSCAGSLVYPFLAANNNYACRHSYGGATTTDNTPCVKPSGLLPGAVATDTEPVNIFANVFGNSTVAKGDKHKYNAPFYRSSEFLPVIPEAYASWDPSGFSGSRFGYSLSTGDLNGDGFDDLAIGAPGAGAVYSNQIQTDSFTTAGTTHTKAGAAFVYLGSNTGIYQERLKTAISPEKEADCRLFAGATGRCETGKSVYSSGQDQVLGSHLRQLSPMKFTVPFSVRTSDELFGTSLTISNAENLSGGIEERTGNSNTGTLWVGAPGSSSKAGAVYVYQPFENITQASQVIQPVQQFFVARIQGATNEELGAALASGNFKDPRRQKSANIPATFVPASQSLGVDKLSRNRFRESVAAGAPGASAASGRVYVFSDAIIPSSGLGSKPGTVSSSQAANSRTGQNQCNNSLDCPGSIILNPSSSAGARFGDFIKTLRVPLEMTRCDASACKNGSSGLRSTSSVLVDRWQPVFSTSRLDSLMVGAPLANSGKGRAYMLSASHETGLQANTAFEHTAPVIITSTESNFGASMAGGFFNFEWQNPGIAIGAPGQPFFGESITNRGVRISGGGSILLYEPSSTTGQTPIQSTRDLILETPSPDAGTSFFSVSSMPTMGHTGSRPIGDINGDGFTDVIMQHYSPGKKGFRNELLILYGSASGLVTKTSTGTSGIPISRLSSSRLVSDSIMGLRAPQWIDTSTWSDINTADANPLKFYSGVGDINGDGFDDVIVGRLKIVLLYGSSSGLVVTTPLANTSPGERTSKILTFPNAAAAIQQGGGSVISLTDALINAALPNPVDPLNDLRTTDISELPPVAETPGNYYHNDITSGTTSNGSAAGGTLYQLDPSLANTYYNPEEDWGNYNADLLGAKAPICHGDFNGDGFGDLALGGLSHGRSHQYRIPASAPASGPFDYEMVGNPPSVVSSAIRVFYGNENGIQTDLPFYDELADGQNDLLYDYSAYGSVTVVPTDEQTSPLGSACTPNKGPCRPGILFDPYLFVSGQKRAGSTGTAAGFSSTSPELVYSPFRPLRSSQINGAFNSTDPNYQYIKDRFGELCVSAGDIDNDGYDDLIVPLPRSTDRKDAIVIFRGGANGLKNNSNGITGNSIVARFSMDSSATPATLTNQGELVASMLGAASSGLGQVNATGGADFALGAPSLVGKAQANGIANQGGVLLVLGTEQSNLTGNYDLTNPALTDPSQAALTTLVGDHNAKFIKYNVCDRPGTQDNTSRGPCGQYSSTGNNPEIRRAILLRPDSIDEQNRGKRFGEYVDAAGSSNGDPYADLLVPMPNYSINGRDNVGAALVYFGGASSISHLSAGYSSGSFYSSTSPSVAANCDSARCTPLLFSPEFVTSFVFAESQFWTAGGGLTIKPFRDEFKGVGRSRYKFVDVGTRNSSSQDLDIKSSDFILAPRRGVPNIYKDTYDHLGGLMVWY